MVKQRLIVSSALLIYCLGLFSAATIAAETIQKTKSENSEIANEKDVKRQEKLIEELRQHISNAKKEIERLQREKETMMEDTRKLGSDAASWNTKLSQCRSDEKKLRNSETNIRNEMGQLVEEVSRLSRESQRNEKAIGVCKAELDNVKQRPTKLSKPSEDSDCACAVSAPLTRVESDKKFREMGELAEKIQVCEGAVKTARDTCDSDLLELKAVMKDMEKIHKSSNNCSIKLTECNSQKGHLEFLMKGYELVVPSLETEFQEAKQAKEKSEKQAARAVQGAAKYYMYLVAICLLSAIVGAIKLYKLAGETLKRRTAAIIDAKVKEKLESRKNKRK